MQVRERVLFEWTKTFVVGGGREEGVVVMVPRPKRQSVDKYMELGRSQGLRLVVVVVHWL